MLASMFGDILIELLPDSVKNDVSQDVILYLPAVLFFVLGVMAIKGWGMNTTVHLSKPFLRQISKEVTVGKQIDQHIGFRWPIFFRDSNNDRSGTSTPDSQHLNQSVLVYNQDIAKIKLTAPTQYIDIKFWVFNGSGVRISIGDNVTGTVEWRSPLKAKTEILSDETPKNIGYPGHGTFTLRQIISPDELSEGKAHAESAAVRSVNRMFGDEEGPPRLLFTFKTVKVLATADSVNFAINLPDHIEFPY